MLRKMTNVFHNFKFYESTFDTETGVLVRAVEVPDSYKEYGYIQHGTLAESVAKSKGIVIKHRWDRSAEVEKLEQEWAEMYGRVWTYEDENEKKERITRTNHSVSDNRKLRAFSPVPETIDVKITDWCNFGCEYCYMSSTTAGRHAPKELLTSIFAGLTLPPYQLAFGGGEPTAHPDFPWFLKHTRERGTVPNYTTAGHILRDDVFDATNKYCGGVALTYHAFRGLEYFKRTYDTWRTRLDSRVQLNVHVIFDKDVADNLLDLQEIGMKNLNIVLLAYYPNIGRAKFEGLAPKGVYEATLPQALETVQSSGFKVAFSEGLLPYFLSHQLPTMNTQFACQQEGLFSCYVDDKGRVSSSSFDPFEPTDRPEDEDAVSIYKSSFQKIWDKLGSSWARRYDPCDSCKYESQCHIPDDTHYMLCKFAEHNVTMPNRIPARKRRLAVV